MNVFTHTNRFGAHLLAILAVFSLLVSLMPVQALAQEVPLEPPTESPVVELQVATPDPELNPNIDICHATESGSNPYSNGVQVVDANSIIEGQNAHNGHSDGGLDDLGDIIPPFAYGDPNNPTQYPGKNWTHEFTNGMTGQQIAENDCETRLMSQVTLCKIGGTGVGVKNFVLTLDNGSESFGGTKKTGNNGCLTMEVPYGTYTFDEVMPNNSWINILNETGTAKGAQLRNTEVVVDEPTEKFTLQNMQCDKENGYFNFGDNKCTQEPQFTDVTLCKVGGTGLPLANWTVSLGQYSGVTSEQNGCVVFDDVPFGSYTVDEVMKSNQWVNVAAEGFVTKGATVEVSKLNHMFTLKNSECERGQINNGQNQCVPDEPEPGNEVITACKYLPAVNEDPREPVSGWGMLFVNNQDPESEGAMALYGTTTENGCITKEVDPDAGPWFVFEQNRAGWTQVYVDETGGYVLGTTGSEFCKFFPQTLLDNLLSLIPFVDETPNEGEHRCDFYNEEDEVVVPACEIGSNLLQNGSFEAPVAPENGWSIFNSVPNWVISLSDGLEIWRNFNGSGAGLASDGAQNVEMDGNDATKITQSVATVAGATYELKFDFSPRAGTGLVENNVDAAANGNLVVNVTGDGSANSANVWTTHGGTFIAAGTSTDISFEDKGGANDPGGLGALIDNARLCLVREPEPPAPACSITMVSDSTNTVDGNAATSTYQHPNWIQQLTGSVADWIWGTPFVVDASATTTQTFTKTFTWNGPVTSAILDIATDNSYVVKVNGVTFGGDASADNFSVADQHDMTSFLQTNIVSGTNTLEVVVTNHAFPTTDPQTNPAGLIYNLKIVGNNSTDCTQDPGGGGDNDELSCTLTASDASVRRGNGVTLNWTTNNASSANVTTLGDLASTSLPNGSGEVAEVNADTTFIMTVMDDSENEATCSATVNTTSGGGGGGGGSRRNNNNDGDVAGDSSSRPEGQVLGEQVSVVPLGAADAGAGGAAPVVLPSFGLTPAAMLGRTRK